MLVDGGVVESREYTASQMHSAWTTFLEPGEAVTAMDWWDAHFTFEVEYWVKGQLEDGTELEARVNVPCFE